MLPQILSLLLALMTASAFAAPLKLALNWKAEPQFGGFYSANLHREFDQRKLTVHISEGGSGTPTIQMLAAGTVDYAVVSADEIVLAHDRGAKDVVAIFASYQTNPQGIMTHLDRKYSSIEAVIKDSETLLWQEGLPYAQFIKKKYGKDFKAKTAPYMGGIGNFQNDSKISQQVFVTSEPLTAEKAGLKIKTFLVADTGYNPYTTVLVTKASRLKEKPDEVKAIVAAVRAGWNTYLKTPETVNQMIREINKSMDPETLKKSADAQKPLIETKDAQGATLGTMTEARWQALVDQLSDLKLIKTKPAAKSLFKNL